MIVTKGSSQLDDTGDLSDHVFGTVGQRCGIHQWLVFGIIAGLSGWRLRGAGQAFAFESLISALG